MAEYETNGTEVNLDFLIQLTGQVHLGEILKEILGANAINIINKRNVWSAETGAI